MEKTHLVKYENGQLKLVGKLVNNKRQGPWVFCNPRGVIKQIKTYKEGKVDVQKEKKSLF